RMHEGPKHGVVDPNCCVHGMSNLFLAGSPVFPTSGYANPTLTIVALALRLADHLKAQLHRLAEPVYTAPTTESLRELNELADEVATPVPA
ncbi:MAG: GMC family oxidoreductase, partial [Gemmatimonadaceae bacterium]|nr:GMC family oxidoreductase [Acetobacteraceae bacterium]